MYTSISSTVQCIYCSIIFHSIHCRAYSPTQRHKLHAYWLQEVQCPELVYCTCIPNFAVVYYIDFYPKLFILCSLVYTAIFSMPYAFFLKTIITSSSTTGSGTFFCNYINCKRRSFIHCRWTETSERIETSIDTVHVVSYAFDAQYNQIQWSTSNIKT